MVYGLDMLLASRQGYASREVWQVMAYRVGRVAGSLGSRGGKK